LKSVDLAIIGNGILGLMTALELVSRDPSLKIAVIGPSNREGGASQAAGAMLNCFGEITSMTFHSTESRQKFDLARAALRRWPEFLERLNDLLPNSSRLVNKTGTFIILNSSSGRIESENFDAMVAALQRFDERYEEVDPNAIDGLKPNQNKRPLRALYLADEGLIDARRFLDALRPVLAERQVQFLEKKAVRFVRNGSGYAVELSDTERVIASRCLLAAGVFTQDLLDSHPELSRRIPRLFPGVGVSMVLSQDPAAPVRQVIRTPNRAGACGLHALPLSDGSLYLGASNDVFIRPQTTPMAGVVHFLLECAMEQINPNLYRSTPIMMHTGNRPVTADGFPLIGRTSWDGLFILSGTHRDGFHQSPVLARIMADEILGTKPAWEHCFHPERPLIRTLSRAQSIRLYLDHLLAAYYEHGWDVAKISNEDSFRKMAEDEVNRLCTALGIDYGLAPEILLMHELKSDYDRAHSLMTTAYTRHHGTHSATALPRPSPEAAPVTTTAS
jgi:glycine/D-amino acid oxidase-like deaminating enzyme